MELLAEGGWSVLRTCRCICQVLLCDKEEVGKGGKAKGQREREGKGGKGEKVEKKEKER